MTEQLRTCLTCGDTKPITQYRNAGFGRHRNCIPCVTAKGLATKAAKTAVAEAADTKPTPRRRSPWEWTGNGPITFDPNKLPAGWR